MIFHYWDVDELAERNSNLLGCLVFEKLKTAKVLIFDTNI